MRNMVAEADINERNCVLGTSTTFCCVLFLPPHHSSVLESEVVTKTPDATKWGAIHLCKEEVITFVEHISIST